MKCEKIKEKLYLHAGNDLPGFWRLRVDKHLMECDRCQKVLREINESRDLFKESVKSKQVNLSDNEIWQRVNLAISEQKAQYIRPVWIQSIMTVNWQWKLLIGGGIALLFFALILWDNNFSSKDKINQTFHSKQITLSEDVPVVEGVEDGVIVMTFTTADPEIKIVWFFKENSLITKGDLLP